jgi:hypothetical protein
MAAEISFETVVSISQITRCHDSEGSDLGYLFLVYLTMISVYHFIG